MTKHNNFKAHIYYKNRLKLIQITTQSDRYYFKVSCHVKKIARQPTIVQKSIFQRFYPQLIMSDEH